MIQSDFDKIVDTRCDTIKSLLKTKQDEYNFTADRLDSFKKAATLEKITPVKALEGYLTKHVISIYDMMNSDSKYTKARWQEKIGDCMNYLVLLEALLEDTDMYKED